VPEPLDVWIGKEEYGGVPTPTKRESKPPPHWRLEAIAATERPRSLALAPDGRTLAFIQDRDTSDLWRLTLGGGAPVRLTTGRDPMPYWEDTTPTVSPDGSTVAYADQGAIWLVPLEGGPPRRLLEAGSPVWLDERTLIVLMERDDTSRLAVVDVVDPWPRGFWWWSSTASKDCQPSHASTCWVRRPTNGPAALALGRYQTDGNW